MPSQQAAVGEAGRRGRLNGSGCGRSGPVRTAALRPPPLTPRRAEKRELCGGRAWAGGPGSVRAPREEDEGAGEPLGRRAGSLGTAGPAPGGAGSPAPV